MTFTKLATHSVSVVKSNFGNCGGTNPFIPIGYAPEDFAVGPKWETSILRLHEEPSFPDSGSVPAAVRMTALRGCGRWSGIVRRDDRHY